MAGVKKHAQTIRDQAQLKSDTESEEQVRGAVNVPICEGAVRGICTRVYSLNERYMSVTSQSFSCPVKCWYLMSNRV